jgi:hypothetical protein
MTKRMAHWSQEVSRLAEHDSHLDPQPTAGDERYRHLPEPIDIEETISTKEVDPAPDPEAGRDSERDFMLRYAG